MAASLAEFLVQKPLRDSQAKLRPNAVRTPSDEIANVVTTSTKIETLAGRIADMVKHLKKQVDSNHTAATRSLSGLYSKDAEVLGCLGEGIIARSCQTLASFYKGLAEIESEAVKLIVERAVGPLSLVVTEELKVALLQMKDVTKAQATLEAAKQRVTGLSLKSKVPFSRLQEAEREAAEAEERAGQQAAAALASFQQAETRAREGYLTMLTAIADAYRQLFSVGTSLVNALYESASQLAGLLPHQPSTAVQPTEVLSRIADDNGSVTTQERSTLPGPPSLSSQRIAGSPLQAKRLVDTTTSSSDDDYEGDEDSDTAWGSDGEGQEAATSAAGGVSGKRGFAVRFRGMPAHAVVDVDGGSLVVHKQAATAAAAALLVRRPLASLLQCRRKHRKNARELELRFQSEVRGKEEGLLLQFSTAHDMQRFYELAWWAIDCRTAGPHPPRTLSLRVFVTTWNVGNAVPPYSDFGHWLPVQGRWPEEPLEVRPYDIVAVAAQECSYSTADSRLSVEQEFFAGVHAVLGTDYVKLVCESLLHIRLCVFIRKEHYFNVCAVKTSTEATGVAHVIGDKGAVGVSFCMYETGFCFVGAHLEAHTEDWKIRNENYAEIVEGLRLGTDPFDALAGWHYAFFCGDLNYRLELDRPAVLELVGQRDWEGLYKHDQLSREKRRGAVLAGFREGAIDFPPTYRYCRGSRAYSNEKGRAPAWCDRVLYKALPAAPIELTRYACCDAVMTSDHSPVYASFDVLAVRPPTPAPTLPPPKHMSLW